jgi:small subunit ribosomal protein S16
MLTIRLTRVGTTKRAFYRVVVVESSAPRDGRFVEILGHYNPRTEPEVLDVKYDRVAHWVSKGARPSDTVRTLLVRHPEPPVAEVAEETAPDVGDATAAADEGAGDTQAAT